MEQDLIKAAEQLIPSVGFRPTVAKKEYLNLAPDIIADPLKGQLFVNSVSEYFLRVEVISNTLEFIEGYDIDVYSATEPVYAIGDSVKKTINDRDYVWTAIQVNGTGSTVKDPETEPLFWEGYLSARLRQYRESAARELISEAIAEQTGLGFTSEMIKNSVIYSEQSTAQPTQKRGRFVGVQITPTAFKLNRMLIIEKVFLNITDDFTDLTLYLYHSSLKQAIQTFVLTVTDGAKWYDLLDEQSKSICIDTYSNEYNQGGHFYLGFFEGNMAATQQYKNHEVSSPSRNLNQGDDFGVRSIEIQNQKLNGIELPTLEEHYESVDYNDELPFNLKFKELQSFYPKIVENISLFKKAYQHRLAIAILRDMMVSERINEITDNAQAKIEEVLYGNPDNPSNRGIFSEYNKQFKKLITDMNQLFDNEIGMYEGNY